MSKNNPKKQAQPTSELAASSCRNQSNPPLSLLDQAQPSVAEDRDDSLNLTAKTESPSEETASIGLEEPDLKPLQVLQPSTDHKNSVLKLSPAKNEKFDQQLSIDLINPNNIAVSLDSPGFVQ